MKACDRCLGTPASVVSINVQKHTGSGGTGRSMINPKMDLCEQCIDDLLAKIGHMKKTFLKEGDERDPAISKVD